MKYLAFLFVFYLVGMMMLPCSDSFNECRASQANVQLSKEHSHKADTNDSCSPFCNCNCCHTIVDVKFQPYEVASKRAHFEEKKFRFENQHFVSNYYGNIWQPPKLNS